MICQEPEAFLSEESQQRSALVWPGGTENPVTYGRFQPLSSVTVHSKPSATLFRPTRPYPTPTADHPFKGKLSEEWIPVTLPGPGKKASAAETAIEPVEAETGYMQRRLMKALEDITVNYNNVVTISSGEIIQFIYGDDGVDPIWIDSEDKIIRRLEITQRKYINPVLAL